MSSGPRTIRAVWEWLDRPGLESGMVALSRDGVTMTGIVVTSLDDRPLRLRCDLHLGADWTFRTAHLGVESRQGKALLALDRKSSGWFVDGKARDDMAVCDDIDIMGSPSTNTLPIRRLSWQGGQSRDLLTAYIRLPDLAVQPVAQRYTCLSEPGAPDRRIEYAMPAAPGNHMASEQQFECHSVGSGFRALLRLDDDGLVLDYPPYWRRVR